jgi:UPF0042 nucleotide-binding protein
VTTARKRQAPVARSPRFVVLTGLSGAGKSQAIHALEDAGFFCVDNLPVALIGTFADLTLASRDGMRAAVVIDVREGARLASFPRVYRALQRRDGLNPQLVFLEANEAALLKRFSETRRPHPLARGRSAAEGLREERRRLMPIRQLADRIVDSSTLSVHDLRRVILAFASGRRPAMPLAVNIVSFGFKHGAPADADLVFDVRFLPNPHFVPELQPHSGLDRRVSRFVLERPEAVEFLRRLLVLLRFLLPQFVKEGKTYLTIAIGCTGGRHRSVAIAVKLARSLRSVHGVRLRVRHRDMSQEG